MKMLIFVWTLKSVLAVVFFGIIVLYILWLWITDAINNRNSKKNDNEENS